MRLENSLGMAIGHSDRDRGGGEGENVRKSIPAKDTQEAVLGSRLTAWLPEAEWEWHERVRSNLWPCELMAKPGASPTSPASPPPGPADDEG